MTRCKTYDKSVHAFAVDWIDSMKIDQTKHIYPNVVHRLSIKIQEAIEDFMEEEDIQP